MKWIVNLLPRTQSSLLQATLVVLTAVWVSMGGYVIVSGVYLAWNLFNGFVLIINLSVGIVLIAIGIFLWRLSRIACGITKFMIGLLIVVPIVSMVGPCLYTPCSYGDFLSDKLVKYLLFALLAFCSFGILDRHKGEFITSSGKEKNKMGGTI